MTAAAATTAAAGSVGKKPKNAKIKVCFGRPNLEELVIGLVDNTHHGTPMPEKLMDEAREAEAKIYDKSPAARFCDALERGMTSYNTAEMYSMALSHSDAVDGKPPERVSFHGFIAMVRIVCSIEGGLSEDVLAGHFKAVDTSGNGTLDQSDFEHIVANLRKGADVESTIEVVSAPDKKVAEGDVIHPVRLRRTKEFPFLDPASPNPEQAARRARRRGYMRTKKLNEQRKWLLMYCGGANPVEKSLNEISEKGSIPMKVESFAW